MVSSGSRGRHALLAVVLTLGAWATPAAAQAPKFDKHLRAQPTSRDTQLFPVIVTTVPSGRRNVADTLTAGGAPAREDALLNAVATKATLGYLKSLAARSDVVAVSYDAPVQGNQIVTGAMPSTEESLMTTPTTEESLMTTSAASRWGRIK